MSNQTALCDNFRTIINEQREQRAIIDKEMEDLQKLRGARIKDDTQLSQMFKTELKTIDGYDQMHKNVIIHMMDTFVIGVDETAPTTTTKNGTDGANATVAASALGFN